MNEPLLRQRYKQRMRNYENYIRGKRVIVVGTAGYMDGKGKGKFIDSHDVVVRLNMSAKPKSVQDFGKRTDVLYTYAILAQNKDNKMMCEYWKDLTKLKGVKHLRFTNGRKQYFQYFKQNTPKTVTITTLDKKYYSEIKTSMHTTPNTGTVAVMDLLRFNPKSITVIGIDLYASGYSRTYKGEGVQNNHNFEVQAAWFYLNRDRLILDEAMKSRMTNVLRLKDEPAAVELPPISILIPYKSDGGQRDRLIEWNIERIKMMIPEAEICIGDLGDEPFNRSKAINKAASLASHDTFCIMDSDALFDRRFFELAYEASQHNWLRVNGGSFYLTEDSTEELLNSRYPLDVQTDISQLYGCNFFTILTREQFETVGGFDEKFRHWGSEDVGFYESLKIYFGKHSQVLDRIWHLWHPVVEGRDDKLDAIHSKRFSVPGVTRHWRYKQARTVDHIRRIRESNYSDEMGE